MLIRVRQMFRLFFGAAPGLMVALACAGSVHATDTAPPIAGIATVEAPVSATDTLSAKDEDRYRAIFAAQEKGDWKRADKLIKKLDNRILMGPVIFQRLMHPTDYLSKYSELKSWMKDYADVPEASRVYRLALRRQGKASAPKAPVPASPPSAGIEEQLRDKPVFTKPRLNASQRRALNRLTSRVRRETRAKRPEAAERWIWAYERAALLPHRDFDKQMNRVAASYFHEGNPEKAYILASMAADRSRPHFSAADWTAGLAAWRLGKLGEAARHFEAVSSSPQADSWLRSAGAYWAARSRLRDGLAGEATPMLKVAASYPDTFYGILAAHQLGLGPQLDLTVPLLTTRDHALVGSIKGVQRAVALTEIGEIAMADEELRLAWSRGGETARAPLLALAARLNLPSSQNMMSRGTSGAPYPHSVRYPVPDYVPDGGYTVDPALIFAMIRQESNFRARVRSRVGAVGLMQLMPATASYIARDASLRSSGKRKLYKPSFNMHLGQTYFHHLFDKAQIEGNLFKLLTAYNGGPGNLSRWEKRISYDNDPLLFIETIPALETRTYIERVFANLWIYRALMGQEAPTLEAVAAGAWPDYEPQDEGVKQLAAAKKGQTRHASAR